METKTINAFTTKNTVTVKEIYNLNLVSCNRSGGVTLECGSRQYHIPGSVMETIVKTFLPID